MAQKKITDLTLRTDFDGTVNLPGDDTAQTWRVTGAQILDYVTDNLNPMTTLGDLIRGAASGVVQRLGIGTTGQFLRVVSGLPEWSTPEISFSADKGGSNQTGVNPNGSNVKITYGTQNHDTGSCYDPVTSTFTVPAGQGGTYHFDAMVGVQGTNVLANFYQVILHKNGSQFKGGTYWQAAAGNIFARDIHITLPLNAGDTIEIYLFGQGNNSASTITADGQVLQSHFSGFKVM